MFREVEFTDKGRLINMRNKSRLDIKKPMNLMLQIDTLYAFNARHYYIMQGNGVINILDFPHKKPAFQKVNVENLAYYIDNLSHATIDYEEQDQIETFYKIYVFNEQNSRPLLYNKAYLDLERALFGICYDSDPPASNRIYEFDVTNGNAHLNESKREVFTQNPLKMRKF